MTNDDKNFQELKELLINKASDMGFTYSTYGLESLAEAILDAGYSRPTPQQPSEVGMNPSERIYEIIKELQQKKPSSDFNIICFSAIAQYLDEQHSKDGGRE